MEDFNAFIHAITAPPAYCRMCLSTDRVLTFADSYRELLQRINTPLNHTEVPANARVCFVCAAQLKECRRLVDLLIQAERYAALLIEHPIEIVNSCVEAHPEVVAYQRHRKCFENPNRLWNMNAISLEVRGPVINIPDDAPPSAPHSLAGCFGSDMVRIPGNTKRMNNKILLQQRPDISLQHPNHGIGKSMQLHNNEEEEEKENKEEEKKKASKKEMKKRKAEDTTEAEEDTTKAEEDTTEAEEDTTEAEEDTTEAEEDTTEAEEPPKKNKKIGEEASEPPPAKRARVCPACGK